MITKKSLIRLLVLMAAFLLASGARAQALSGAAATKGRADARRGRADRQRDYACQ